VSEKELKSHSNPHSFLDPPVDFLEAEAIPVPPGTKAPPRPPGRERVPGQELPAEGPFEVFECKAIPLPPGTKAPPRPPGKERLRPAEAAPSSPPIDELVTRIESALATLQDALEQLKNLRGRAS
jgi:hypothetical protein